MRREASYIIWGAAGHALVLAECITRIGGRILALFDNAPLTNSPLPDTPLFIGKEGFSQWLATTPRTQPVLGLAAIGGGRGNDRLHVLDMYKSHGILTPSIVHPDATVHVGVQIGEGSQILAKSLVAAGTRVGRASIINHRAGIDHECILGDGVHIAPGATLCGCVTVADNVFIGASAVVLPRITIGTNAIIGAGAVVTRNVAANTTVIGNPARKKQ